MFKKYCLPIITEWFEFEIWDYYTNSIYFNPLIHSHSPFTLLYPIPLPSSPPPLSPHLADHPTATITYQELTVTSSTPHQLNFTDGDEGPTFVCKASGYSSPTLTWQKNYGSSLLPNQVNSTVVNGSLQLIRELHWPRSLRHSDSGSYSCTAQNNNGTDTATLNLLVRRELVPWVGLWGGIGLALT